VLHSSVLCLVGTSMVVRPQLYANLVAPVDEGHWGCGKNNVFMDFSNVSSNLFPMVPSYFLSRALSFEKTVNQEDKYCSTTECQCVYFL